MQKKIQPKLKEVSLICATCKKEHNIFSTVSNIHIETCSNCHPFYTGTQSFTTVAGQVDKFNKRYNNKMNKTNNNIQDTNNNKQDNEENIQEIE